MSDELKDRLQTSVDNIDGKTNKFYFFVQDTKGNPKISIAYIYEMALALKEEGYNVLILTEKDDYTGVGTWLGDGYMEQLEHVSLEKGNLNVSPEDFLIIPELFGFIMEQTKNLPCNKVVISQAYDHALETLQPGSDWAMNGFTRCITTGEQQKEYLSKLMKRVTYEIIEPFIYDNFKEAELPPKPIVSIHTRDQRDGLNIIKSFYLKYPHFRWITFSDLHGLKIDEFADRLKDSCLAVWVDDKSSFGTFPLEAMRSGVPIIGRVPNVTPNWMSSENGIWVTSTTEIPDIIGDYIQNWLEDGIKDELYAAMKDTVDKLPTKDTFKKRAVEIFTKWNDERRTALNEQLNKLTEIPETSNGE